MSSPQVPLGKTDFLVESGILASVPMFVSLLKFKRSLEKTSQTTEPHQPCKGQIPAALGACWRCGSPVCR